MATLFHIDGFFIPYKLERNRIRGGIIVYVRKDIPSKLLSKHSFKEEIEGLFVDHLSTAITKKLY